MSSRTIQVFKDIKNNVGNPNRYKNALKQIKRLNKATLVGKEEFSDEFTKKKSLSKLKDIPSFG